MAKISREKFKVFEGVFDENTLSTLEFLKRKKYFDELGKVIKPGKEGDVYYATKEGKPLAIKLYRVTSANFKKISTYITRDFRFRNIKGNLRKVIMAWVQKEARNLQICHKVGMSVPYPYKQANNVIIMDYIQGDTLNNVGLDNPQHFFELLLEQMYLMKNEAKLIHGDLSAYNIMVDEHQLPVIIDVGQAMGFKNKDDFKELEDLYIRDVQNVINHFNKYYKMNLELEDILKKLEE